MATFIKQYSLQGQVLNIYEIIRTLGSGGFAQVYQVLNLCTSVRSAIKVVSKHTLLDPKAFSKLKLQIKIHKKLIHKNIVKLEKVFEDQDSVYLLMQLCQNFTLKQLLQQRSRLTEFQIRYYINQILHALQYLHSNRILHRDLKLGNIFINEKMQLKLGDFGLSVKLKDINEKRYTTCGTPNYIAPEILKQQGHTFGVDIWAVGIIAYTLLMGKPPFERDTVDETYQAIESVSYKFPMSVPVSKEGRDFVQGVIRLEPERRYTLEELKQHPFVSKIVNMVPRQLPKELLKDPPPSRLLKQYNSCSDLHLPVLPRRLSNLPSQSSSHHPTHLKQKLLKLKRSTSFHMLSPIQLQSLQSPTVSNLLSHKKSNNNNISKTKHSASHSSKPKIARSKSSNFMLDPAVKEQEESVEHVIDWSEKYGVGYVMNSGVVGFVFNDKTSMRRCKNTYYYLDKQSHQYQYSQKNIPITLFKKFKILTQSFSTFPSLKGPSLPKSNPTFFKRYIKKNNILILKSNTDICYFIWEDCKIRLKGYREVRWRMKDGEEGRGSVMGKWGENRIGERVRIIRGILEELTNGQC